MLVHASAAEHAIDMFDKQLPLPIYQAYDSVVSLDGEIIGTSELIDIVDNRIVLTSDDPRHRKEYELLKTEIAAQADYGDTLFRQSAIVGMVSLVDIVQGHESPWSAEGSYHWVLADAVLFETPIIDVKGKLRIWEYEGTLEKADMAPYPMIRR